MFGDQCRLAIAHKTKAHAEAGILGAAVVDRRIEGERNSDRAAAVGALKELWDREFVDREVADCHLVLSISSCAAQLSSSSRFTTARRKPNVIDGSST
ncbi:hypothetical protein MesoLj113b_71310 (plasmid) [Mesorhizobium sp. 113-3-3]|nr:hypothetical protein MesoLj113b_71310 [Mesorhizobium sp. 113-3-3]